MSSDLPPDAADDSGPDSQPPRRPLGSVPAEDQRASTEGAARLEGIIVGHWRSTRLLIGWSWPALVVVVLGGAWWFRRRPADGDLPNLAILLLVAAAVGSVVQALLRIELAHRFRRPLRQLTLTAIGYRAPFPWASGAASGAGGGAQRLVLVAGPTLAILVGGLGLVLSAALIQPPESWWPTWRSPELSGEWQLRAVLRVVAWVWLTQAALMGLPIPGSVGRQILYGVVERAAMVCSAAPSAGVVQRRVDQLQGGIAALLAAAAVWQWQRETVEIGAPAWPFLIALSLLVWCGRGGPAATARRVETIPGEPLDSEQDERVVAGSAVSRSHEPARPPRRRLSWWSRFRIRRAQRAERGEAVDATRLDEVLERLHRDGFESLSAAERSILRRVSQRLRQNRERHS